MKEGRRLFEFQGEGIAGSVIIAGTCRAVGV
jgi:hypothetical protein